MKQIKVYITPEQWAEKRLQLICHSYELTYHPERFDSLLEACGFELIESETKPEQQQPSEIPTDKVEAVKYFLNQLPSGYRERALAQVDETRVKGYPLSCKMIEAIMSFSLWRSTKEGEDFWSDVDNYYRFPDEYRTLPPLPND